MTALSEPASAMGFGQAQRRAAGGAQHPIELVVDDRPTVVWDDDDLSSPVAAAPTRADLRRQAEAAARADRSRQALWRAWWVYPLLAAAVLCGWLGLQSSSVPAPAAPVVVTVAPTG